MTGVGNFCKNKAKTDNCFCVAKENIVAERQALNINVNLKSTRVIRLGSLVKVISTKYDGDRVAVRLIVERGLVEGSEDVWVCSKFHLLPVDPVMLPSLTAVFEPSHRVALVQNGQIFRELAAVEVGEKVMLLPETQDSRSEPELAVVRYKGPVPEMGPGTYYGLEILVLSTQGKNDGSAFGRRFFQCPSNAGVFVALNRLGPYRDPKALNLGQSIVSGGENCSEVVGIPSGSSMPSNERRVHQNGRNHDAGNFRTTLVLRLKEKESIPRNIQPIKLEKTEKLIDLELAGENGDSGNVPLKVGDRVVWILDTKPEQGIVRWLGHLDGHTLKNDLMAGVEFEKPIGDSSGMYKKQQLFQAKKNHGQFIPVISLVKADDFFGSPTAEIVRKKVKNMKLIENCNSSRHSQNLPTSSQKSDALLKTQRSESFLWSPHLVELANSATNNSQNREDLILKEGDDNICKSEYVFSESNLDQSSVTSKIDHVNKRNIKDSKNNNVGKRTGYNLSDYPIGEANPRDYFLTENIPGSRHTCEDRTARPTEGKIRHSYSQDLQSHHSPDDFLSELWPPISENNQHKSRIKDEKKSKTFTRKPDRLNNSADPHLEVVGEGIQKLFAVSGQDVEDPLLSVSPTGSIDYFETPDSPEPKQPHDLGVGSVVEVTVSGEPRYGVIRWIGIVPEDKKARKVAGIEMKVGVGSVVEVTVSGEPRYGVIRWIGIVPEDKKARKVAGIEMEEEHCGYTDGTFNGRRYFQCNARKAMFVSLNMCQKDGRFQDVHPALSDTKIKAFGQVQCPVIPGAVRPISREGDLETLCGKYRGIQGHHNSCYLDATLFSMFTFTSVFDSLLFRPQTENDVPQYQEVQRVLREEIVNPLRQNLYVRADRVMKLRTLLENLSSVTGLTSEEKDPEEFLTSLIAQILRAEPFLKLSSGQEAYHYQLFVEKDEHLVLPSVQQLFEQSFLASDIKLKEVPSCLIIQMPRFGKSFKMYPRILPSQLLDVTDIIEDSPRQCTICGKLAELECKECFDELGAGLESMAFCAKCLERTHSHQRRTSHGLRPLCVPIEFSILQDHCPVPRLFMELFAVVCIETSHYVAFVKCGSGSDAPWCFFDSMADRKGEQNGYNIPEMVSCPDLPYWLSDEGARSLREMKDDRQLPEHAKRLLCDAYMCMYQSPDVMMYR